VRIPCKVGHTICQNGPPPLTTIKSEKTATIALGYINRQPPASNNSNHETWLVEAARSSRSFADFFGDFDTLF
jgi:hypothetical protein